MKTVWLVGGMLFLASSQFMFAQNSLVPSAAVSFYQLSYKPDKRARRLVDKGYAYLRRREYQLSLALFQRAIEIDPRYWAAENNLGCVYLKLADTARAEEVFRRAVEIDPQNSIGFTNLSVAAVNSNRYRNAEVFARQALRLNPEQIEAKALLGLAEAGQGNWSPEAHRLLEEGRQYIPGSERLLRKWPRSNSDAPALLVVQGLAP